MVTKDYRQSRQNIVIMALLASDEALEHPEKC